MKEVSGNLVPRILVEIRNCLGLLMRQSCVLSIIFQAIKLRLKTSQEIRQTKKIYMKEIYSDCYQVGLPIKQFIYAQET